MYYCDERFIRPKQEIFWTNPRTHLNPRWSQTGNLHFEKTASTVQSQLTAREAQIAQYVVNGYTCKEIVKLLGFIPRTIEVHKTN